MRDDHHQLTDRADGHAREKPRPYKAVCGMNRDCPDCDLALDTPDRWMHLVHLGLRHR